MSNLVWRTRPYPGMGEDGTDNCAVGYAILHSQSNFVRQTNPKPGTEKLGHIIVWYAILHIQTNLIRRAKLG